VGGACPLYPQKQTLELSHVMSAMCHKQTFAESLDTLPVRAWQQSLAIDVADGNGDMYLQFV